jgi:hypothetical protein
MMHQYLLPRQALGFVHEMRTSQHPSAAIACGAATAAYFQEATKHDTPEHAHKQVERKREKNVLPRPPLSIARPAALLFIRYSQLDFVQQVA